MDLQNVDDERVFDRLADGELSDQERRALLASLDSRSDGWRRCALALLEAQAWREQFRQPLAPSLRPVATPVTLKQKRSAAMMPSALALAASALVAFSIGLLVNVKLPGGGGSDIANTSIDQPSSKRPPGAGQKTNSPQGNGFAERMVTLAVADGLGDKSKQFELPLTDVSSAEDMFEQLQPDYIQEFERSGHEVTAYRDFFPLRLQDGRTLVVPVDDVQVTLIGSDTY